MAPSVWKPPPNAPSTSAPGPTARSNPSSTTTLTGVLRASAPRTERRSCTPTSVGRATTIRRDDLLKHPTLDQLNALGLHGMAKAFVEIAANGQADGLGHHEWLGLLLDREASWRQDKRFAARLRVAKLRQQASVEDIDYRHVFTERVGGGFGGKQEMVTEDLCVLATLSIGRPVQWEYTREEQFTAATTRHQMTSRVKLGAERDGTLTAIQIHVVSNTGAYGGHGGETLA